MKHHPDRNKNDPGAAVKFKECTRALDDIAKGRTGGQGGQGFGGQGFGQGFGGQGFGQGFGQGGQGFGGQGGPMDEDIERILREAFGNMEGIMQQMERDAKGGARGGGGGGFSESRTVSQRADGSFITKVVRRYPDGRVEMSEESVGGSGMSAQQEAEMKKVMRGAAKSLAGQLVKTAAKALAQKAADSVKEKAKGVVDGVANFFGLGGKKGGDKKH